MSPSGRAVFQTACGVCHTVSGLSTGAIGPELTHISTVAASRRDGMSGEEYIRQSILDPRAYVVEGFPPVMPPDISDIVGDGLGDLLAFLTSLK